MPYRFTIGAGDSLHAWIAAPALAEMQKRGLPWLFALQNLRNSDVPLKLQNMDVDFGIVRTSALAAEGLESRVIRTMDYALYVPAALAGKGTSGTSADFPRLMETLPLATLAGGSGFYASLKRSCMEYGIDLRVQCETQSFPFAARMLKSGRLHGNPALHGGGGIGKGFFQGHPSRAGQTGPQHFPGLESAAAARTAFRRKSDRGLCRSGTGLTEEGRELQSESTPSLFFR